MIHRVIEYCVKNRIFVLLLTLLAIVAGAWALINTPVDAIPDLSDVQVIVYTEFQGQDPQTVEEQVTYPLTTAMLAVPHAKVVRGYSFFGFSLTYIIFEDGVDLYWARSRVLEYLNVVKARLPAKVTPQLGPDATGVGWVYMYSLTSTKHDLAQLRSLQDWFLRYELMAVPGVSEVASIGGFVKQYQVEVDPEKLRAFNIPLSKVRRAIERSNIDVGGRLIEMAETEFMVRGKGYIGKIEDLENIAVDIDRGRHTPVLLKQLARVQIGPEIRRGIAEMNGEGEVVTGIVEIRFGENALKVIAGVKKRLEELRESLPEGVEIHTSYDRSRLILRGIDTLKSKIVEELIVVAIVCFIFLFHFSSAFVAVVSVPLGILLSFFCMRMFGINANIMSLSGIAIAIGVMVDASIVMVENLHKHKERDTEVPFETLVINSAREVGPALFFSLLIITVSFLPVFALEQQEGRLFAPLAYTKTFAMAMSAIVAVTVVPVLMYYFVGGKVRHQDDNPLNRICIRLYRPVINCVLKFPKSAILVAMIMGVLTIFPYSRLGSEFMPPLNEGDLLYMPTTPPGISITKAKELLQQTNKIIKAHPQVLHVLGKVGRADTATDPAPLSMIESTIVLKPKEEWPAGTTIESIIKDLDSMVRFPGVTNAWTMPIKTRIDMLATGIKTPVGIKLLGDNLETLSKIGEQIEAILRNMPETLSVYSERVVGGKFIDIDIDREQISRFGLNIADVQDVIMSAIGGMNISTTVEGLERFPVNLRFPRELRDNLDKLKRVAVPTPLGHTIPLAYVADIKIAQGPPAIKSENARRSAWVYVDLKTSDIGGYVSKAKKLLKGAIKLPKGVTLVWSGQFEYMERANQRLTLVIPLTLVIIFVLLFLHFHNISESVIVMLALPFALIGGVWFMYFAGYNFSVAVAVGFIALAGLAAETGIVMLVYLDEVFERRLSEGQISTLIDLKDCVIEGAVERVRPKLMTVSTTIIGLMPIMYSAATGSRIMKRIAAPMVGGMLSATILTLIIIPAIYLIWKQSDLDLVDEGENPKN